MPSLPSPALPVFQTYILPVIPFRRRHSSNTSNSTVTSGNSISPTSPTADVTSPQPDVPQFLTAKPRSTIACSRCHADLALTSQIISKGFTGRHGRAYLVSATDPTSLPTSATKAPASTSSGRNTSTTHDASRQPTPEASNMPWSSISGTSNTLPNTHTHKPVPRHLVTGLHTVSDVSCAVCGSVLGWKYVGAEEEAQRYKVGKFILESRRTVVDTCWEERGNDPDEVEENGGVSVPVGYDEEIMFDSQDEDECEDLFAGVWSPQVARRRRLRRFGLRG